MDPCETKDMDGFKAWILVEPSIRYDRRPQYKELHRKLRILPANPIQASDEELAAAMKAFVPGNLTTDNGILVQWKRSRLPYYVEVEFSRGLSGSNFIDVATWEKLGFNPCWREAMTAIKAIQKSITDGVTYKPHDSMYLLLQKLHDDKQKETTSRVLDYMKTAKVNLYHLDNITVALAQVLAEAYNTGIIGSGPLALTLGEFNAIPAEDKKAAAEERRRLKKREQKRERNKNRHKKSKATGSTVVLAADSASDDEEDTGTAGTGVPEVVKESPSVLLSLDKAEDVAGIDQEQPLLAPAGSDSAGDGIALESPIEAVNDTRGARPAPLDTSKLERSEVIPPKESIKTMELSPADQKDAGEWYVVPKRQQKGFKAKTSARTTPRTAPQQPTHTITTAMVPPTAADFPALGTPISKKPPSSPHQRKPQGEQPALQAQDAADLTAQTGYSVKIAKESRKKQHDRSKSSSEQPEASGTEAPSTTKAQDTFQDGVVSVNRAIRATSISTIQASTRRRSTMASNSERPVFATERRKTIVRAPIAMPDLKILFKNDINKTGETTQSSNTTSPAKQDERRVSISKLRAEAPEFLPTQYSSNMTSPEFAAYNSVPMSMSTSFTDGADMDQNADATLEAMMEDMMVEDKGKARADDLETNATAEGSEALATMSYPFPRDTTARPFRTNSLAPAITISNFDEEKEKIPLKPEEKYKLEIWPSFPPFDSKAPCYNLGLHSGPKARIDEYGRYSNMYTMQLEKRNIRPKISERYGIPMDVGAVLMETTSGNSIATAQFDKENNVWRIYPASNVFQPDPRCIAGHFDHCSPGRLREIQSLELFGFLPFRSSRVYHECHKEGCNEPAGDDDADNVFHCYGCGPLSPVRYCSIYCFYEDMPDHFKECGTEKFWPPAHWAVDQNSFSNMFNNVMPMIQDVNDFRSFERHRIFNVAATFQGQYALFPEHGDKLWETYLVNWNEGAPADIRDRFTRLLNCAMLDHTLKPLITYMYLLVRDALYVQYEAEDGEMPCVLNFQLRNEWHYDWIGPEYIKYVKSIRSCECMWKGTDNSPECANGCRAGKGIESEYKKQGLQKWVEKLEQENWILRAWRYTHPNTKDWRDRLIGKGFPGVKYKHVKYHLPVLGVGYSGYVDKNRRVGDWRPRLNLTNVPPPGIVENGFIATQLDDSFIWEEPEKSTG